MLVDTFFYLAIGIGMMKNEQEEGNIRDYSVGNVSSDMNFTLTQQNT